MQALQEGGMGCEGGGAGGASEEMPGGGGRKCFVMNDAEAAGRGEFKVDTIPFLCKKVVSLLPSPGLHTGIPCQIEGGNEKP